MIGKQLSSVEWTDIGNLVAFCTPESDALEFKSSFKGSADLTTLNDRQRDDAIDALTREVIAFLNTRGGDLIIGIDETPNGGAANIVGIVDPQGTAERLSRAISALIEPAQTNVTFRAIYDPEDPDRGVLLIRVRASLRAPHRSKRVKECYVRRGTECVPMPMDEIQDITLNRAMLRQERRDLVDRQFLDFREGRIDHHDMPTPILRCRFLAVPMLEQYVEIEPILAYLTTSGTHYYDPTGKKASNDVAFRDATGRWRPILRGMLQENTYSAKDGDKTHFQLTSRRMKTSGLIQFDYAITFFDEGKPSFYNEWLVGFFADCCSALEAATQSNRQLLPATVHIGIAATGGISMITGSRMWTQHHAFHDQVVELPEFVVNGLQDLDEIFKQLQVDMASMAGRTPSPVYSRIPPPAEVATKA